MECVFTQHELKVLDDVFPQSKRKERMEEEEERRKSIDHGETKMVSDSIQTEMTGFVGPYVTFKDEMFPCCEEALTENEGIHIKTQ